MDRIEKLRKIVETQQAGRVEYRMVDLFSASVYLALHDAMNEKNQAKLLAMPLDFAIDTAFKFCK